MAEANQSAKPSSDPLASVITQVQPGQGAAPLRGGPGPARPTRVAKPGTAKAAAAAAAQDPQRKKKKKSVKPAGENADVATGTVAGTSATTATTASPSPIGQQGASSAIAGPSSSIPPSAQQPSGMVGSSSAIPDDVVTAGAATGALQQSGTTPGAVGIGETDAAAKMDVPTTMTGEVTGGIVAPMAAPQATSSSVSPPSSATVAAASKSKAPTATPASTSQTTPPNTSSKPAPAPAKSSTTQSGAQSSSSRPKKQSGLKKLIAFLTCSSIAGEEAERSRQRNGQDMEMQSRIGSSAANSDKGTKDSSSGDRTRTGGKGANAGQTPSTAGPSKGTSSSSAPTSRLAPPVTATPKSRSGRPVSRAGSARNSLDTRSETGVVAPAPGTPTPGGGTMLPREETGDVMSGAVVPPGSSFVVHEAAALSLTATPTPSRRGMASGGGGTTDGSEVTDDGEEETDDGEDEDGEVVDEYLDDEELTEEQRLIAQGGMGIPTDEYGNARPLLEAIGPIDTGRKCLVLDLDETLVHSSFKMISSADFIVPVEIEGTVHNVYVIKRPGVDEFMRRMGEIYEVVVFTASLSKYADPVLDILDIHHVVRHRLFRESCYNHRGNYVKDLSQLGRPIGESIIIDNSPASYIFHPNNAVPISSWFNDPHDTELTDLCPFLADLSEVGDVRAVLDGGL